MTRKKIEQTGTEPVLRKNAAMAFLGLGPTQFDEMVFAGKLPPPIRIVDGGSAIGWIREELVAYVESRKAARDAAPAPKKACAKAGAR